MRISRDETISVSTGASTISIEDYIDVEAVDSIHVTIPKNSVATEVNLQPEDCEVSFIAITAGSYDDLTYTVDEVVTVRTLDGPLVLMGAGVAALLGDPLATLTFTNANITTDNTVDIVVGRNAIEE
jgi:hypothetical protein